jgi:hypothetical protein
MRGAIPPLPNTPSWRGAQLKSTGTTLPLPSTSDKVHFVYTKNSNMKTTTNIFGYGCSSCPVVARTLKFGMI